MLFYFLMIGLRVSAQDWKVVEWPDKSQFRYLIKDLAYSSTGNVTFTEDEFISEIEKMKVEATKSKGSLKVSYEENALSHERILEKGKLALKVIGDDIEQIPAGANKDNW